MMKLALALNLVQTATTDPVC